MADASSPSAKRVKADAVIDVEAMHHRMTSDWPDVRSCATHGELRSLLLRHDAPHATARIEWWYVNGHLVAKGAAATKDGKPRFSFFAAFFRLVVPDDNGSMSKTRHSHAINWAVTDHARGKYLRFSELDWRAPFDLRQLIEREDYRGNPHILAALKELAERQQVPAPDTVMCDDVQVSASFTADESQQSPLRLQYNKNVFEQVVGAPPGTYRLHLEGTTNETSGLNAAAEESVSLEVTLEVGARGPVLHGADGVVSLGNVEGDMFYYFSPHCAVTSGRVATSAAGTIEVDTAAATTGAWIDHEFGGAIPLNEAEDRALQQRAVEQTGGVEGAWEWAALKFADGEALSVTVLTDPRTSKTLQIFAIVSVPTASAASDKIAETPRQAVSKRLTDADGVRFAAVPGNVHTSKATGIAFPTRWKVFIPACDVSPTARNIELIASVSDQEFVTLPAKPSFWEGHVTVVDVECGAVVGNGYVECHGHKDLNSADAYFSLMHTMICVPLQGSVPKINDGAASPTPAAYVASVAPAVEMMAMMAMMGGNVVSQQEKVALKSLCAAYICAYHHGQDALAAGALEWAEAEWQRLSPTMVNDFKRLMFRAFYRFALASVTEELQKSEIGESVQPCAPVVGGDDEPVAIDAPLPPLSERFVIPTLVELSSPCSPAAFAVAERYFSGVFEKSADLTARMSTGTDIGTFLAAQGVNLIVRTMTARLRPVLTTTVEDLEIRTRIKTAVSDDNSVTPVTGRSFEFHSPGRGKLTCRACLQHNGRVLVIRTELPANAMEFKWIHIEDLDDGSGAVKRAMVENLKYFAAGCDFNGQPTSHCCQVYVKTN